MLKTTTQLILEGDEWLFIPLLACNVESHDITNKQAYHYNLEELNGFQQPTYQFQLFRIHKGTQIKIIIIRSDSTGEQIYELTSTQKILNDGKDTNTLSPHNPVP